MRVKTLNCIICGDDNMAPGRRYCVDCHNKRRTRATKEQINQYYQDNKEVIRDRQVWQRLKDRYGITKDQYFEMYEKQDGLCAICFSECKTKQRLVVDHCHQTGKVRGLLCKSCNMSLGVLEKSDWLESALMYLGVQDQ